MKSSPFEEQGLPGELRECIREAITEIQTSRVAALAEVEESLTRKMSLFHSERFHDDASPAKKYIALAAGIRPDLSFNDHGYFPALIEQ